MLFRMHMHKDEAEAHGIGPPDLGHFDGERLIGGRKLDMKGEAGTGRQRFLTHHMATFLGQTRDQAASGNIATGKREWHLNLIPGTVATFHRVP